MEIHSVPASSFTLDFTDRALERIAFFLSKPEHEGKSFRVAVLGGGCSGFKYDFLFDEAKPEDKVLFFDKVKILLDPAVSDLIAGSQIDYVDDLKATGFVVTNPNATGTCGCGVSFSV